MDDDRTRNKLKTRLLVSFLVTVFCFLPLGIAAIVFATRALTQYDRGDEDAARRSDNAAYICIMLSIIVWLAALAWLFSRV